jgi:short-subunit dehydrogenase
MDLSQPVELAPLLSDLDSIEVLVHCAALADVASFADAAPDTWRRTFAVNAVAAAELTAALLPALRAARGHVFFINMAPGMRAVPRWSAYVASKAALRELADSLRAEEGGNGIRVTSVYPGGTATELLRKVRDQFGRPFDPDACMQPETLAAIVIAALDCPPEAQLSELSVNAAPRG